MTKTVPLASLLMTTAPTPISSIKAEQAAVKPSKAAKSSDTATKAPAKRHSTQTTPKQKAAKAKQSKKQAAVSATKTAAALPVSPETAKTPAVTEHQSEPTNPETASETVVPAITEPVDPEGIEAARSSQNHVIRAVGSGSGSGIPGGMDSRPNEWVSQSSLNIWPHQARQDINQASIQQMADSLRDSGQLNPGHTFVDDDGHEWLITGQRRLLGLRELVERGEKAADAPFQVIRLGHLSHADAMTISLVENFQRDGLTLKDQVSSIDVLYSQQNLTVGRIASQVGLSETQVRRYISFRNLDDATMAEVDAGTLTSEQAELLARASDHMRPTVRGWIREGKLSLTEIAQMISQQSSTIYMRDALFDPSEYQAVAGPKAITQSLFDGEIATDRTVFMSLQREHLERQITDGQHGPSSEHHVILSADIPADRRLQEDETGTVLIGLINPSNGQVRVARCSPRLDTTPQAAPLSERERALANVRARMAREVVRGTGLGLRYRASDTVLLTLLVQQLGGGERAFALGRHESGELLGLANPSLGLEDHMYHEDNTSHVTALLRHCYEGTAQTHRIVLLNAGVQNVDGSAFASETGSRELSLLFGGVTGQREQLISQVRGLPLDLELTPIRSAVTQLREAAQALRGAQITTEQARELMEVSDRLDRGEPVTDGRIQTVWEEWLSTLKSLTAGHRPATMSPAELLGLYETCGDTPEAKAFKAAVDCEDYPQATKLAAHVRRLN